MKVGIVGSRTFTDQDLMINVLMDFKVFDHEQGRYLTWWDMTLVSGGAVGADSIAAQLYREVPGRPEPDIHLPDKERFGWPRAALERNTLIVRDSDILLAFFGPGEPPSVNESGTMDTVRKAMKKRIPIRLYFQQEAA